MMVAHDLATEWAIGNSRLPGTYVLLVSLGCDTKTRVGSLGTLFFKAGYYLYVGSALGGLGARIGRHLRTRKRLHWHIDYLLRCGTISQVWYRVSPNREECLWARALVGLSGVEESAAGFGASDCSCRTHLFYSPVRPEPLPRGAGFEFDSEIFGGSVPRQYVPAVEKGIRGIMRSGVIAGYPTVDFKCVLYDGSYHSVDSSEISFKLAAHLAFRSAIPDGGPVLLEPIMDLTITVPEIAVG